MHLDSIWKSSRLTVDSCQRIVVACADDTPGVVSCAVEYSLCSQMDSPFTQTYNKFLSLPWSETNGDSCRDSHLKHSQRERVSFQGNGQDEQAALAIMQTMVQRAPRNGCPWSLVVVVIMSQIEAHLVAAAIDFRVLLIWQCASARG